LTVARALWLERVQDADVWGYRRYRHDGPNKTASGLSVVAPDAESLLVRVRPGEGRASLDLVGETGLSSEFGETLPFDLKRQQGRTWSAEVSLTESEEDHERAFVIGGMFGFGAYL